MIDQRLQRLITRLKRNGQKKLADYLLLAGSKAREHLVTQLEQVPFEEIWGLWKGRQHKSRDIAQLALQAQPPLAVKYGEPFQGRTRHELHRAGQQLLASGQVAVVIVAGGEGTRLGFPKAKGLFPIGPVSGASLLQVLVEKALARARAAGGRVPVLVMTSKATHQDVADHFSQHRGFGLDQEELKLFVQGTLPAVDSATGELLLRSEDSLCLSPDGHGGLVQAMHTHGIPDWCRDRGIRYLFYLQVDNPLAPVADPLVLGYHLASGSEMTTLVVRKEGLRDPVGNVVRLAGRTQVIEYSELNSLPDELLARETPQGEPVFWAGNVAIHVINLELIEHAARPGEVLPLHLAHKRVPHWDPGTRTLTRPQEPNAYKFERFIFDLLPQAQQALVVEVSAQEHFAPVKNAPGAKKDTPEHARRAIVELHRRWLRQAGAQVADSVPVEISPLVAPGPEELRHCDWLPKQISQPTYISR